MSPGGSIHSLGTKIYQAAKPKDTRAGSKTFTNSSFTRGKSKKITPKFYPLFPELWMFAVGQIALNIGHNIYHILGVILTPEADVPI